MPTSVCSIQVFTLFLAVVLSAHIPWIIIYCRPFMV
jgi:hypothetical protein